MQAEITQEKLYAGPLTSPAFCNGPAILRAANSSSLRTELFANVRNKQVGWRVSQSTEHAVGGSKPSN
jgi:hypothetical protein